MPLSGPISMALALSESKSIDFGAAQFPISKTHAWTIISGVGAGQADLIWTDTVTIAASATLTLDLAGGSLLGMFGAVSFAKLKALVVIAAPGNANTVHVVRPANGVPWALASGDGVPVLPDGRLVWVAPGAGVIVTAGTGDLLDLVNSAGGTSVTADVALIGTSA